jgi:hypothetical protein
MVFQGAPRKLPGRTWRNIEESRQRMDSKYSFLDQDGLFNDGGSPEALPRQAQPAQLPAAAGGMAAGMAEPQQRGPMAQQPPPQQPSDGFAEALDSIARALAYTEKRVASAEARLLAALQDNSRPSQEKKPGAWSGALAIFGALILLFLLIGVAVACGKGGGGAPPQQMPMIVRAGPAPTPLVLAQSGAMGPPATFLS